MKRCLVDTLVAIAITVSLGCNRGPKQEVKEDSPLDHVAQAPRLAPQRVTHGLAKLDKYEKFSFEVPAHVISAKVRGEFTSFLQGAGGARISDEAADVELMIMSEEQFDAFTHRRSAESVYAIEPSHDHGVSITLPATQDAPVRYYAVFRRTTDAKTPVWVNADLTIDFGSL